VVDDVRASLARDGCAVLEGFLTEEAIVQIHCRSRRRCREGASLI
jgi:hypothetical protein